MNTIIENAIRHGWCWYSDTLNPDENLDIWRQKLAHVLRMASLGWPELP